MELSGTEIPRHRKVARGTRSYTVMDAERIIEILGLTPHPTEGGYFVETYRSDETIPRGVLPARYPSDKAFSTAIYYLLEPATFSAMHRLASDEVYHFYLGDAVEMLLLHPDGSHRIVNLGTDLEAGQRPQVMVPRGVWQGSRLVPGGAYALMGTTVAPGFDYPDYEHGERAALVSHYPECATLIKELTRG